MAAPHLTNYSQWMTPDATVIYSSRGKLLLMALGGGAFVALGLFLTDMEERAAGLAAVVFFGLCALYAVWRLVRPTPALIIHPLGILDNASALPAGFLRWDEISGVFVARIKNQRFLAIALRDVNALLSRQSSLKARMMKVNILLTGAAINIPATTLPISLEELIQKIQETCPGIQVVDPAVKK
jgi:hypothetical protein